VGGFGLGNDGGGAAGVKKVEEERATGVSIFSNFVPGEGVFPADGRGAPAMGNPLDVEVALFAPN